MVAKVKVKVVKLQYLCVFDFASPLPSLFFIMADPAGNWKRGFVFSELFAPLFPSKTGQNGTHHRKWVESTASASETHDLVWPVWPATGTAPKYSMV